MNVNHNDTENFIDNMDDFLQYRSWLLSGQEGKKINQNTTQVSTAQLDGGSNFHVFPT